MSDDDRYTDEHVPAEDGMTENDLDAADPEGGVYRSTMPDRLRKRRRRTAAGAVVAAAVLGGGAYLVTDQLADRDTTTAIRDIAPPAPVVSATPSPSPATAGPASVAPSRPARDSVRRTNSPVPATTSPATASADATADSVTEGAAEAPVTERTVQSAKGTIRVVGAPFNLTGQREMTMPADDGRRVGNARCTQKLHVSGDDTAHTIPSMLVCWRTSEKRSVVTIAVATEGRPSATDSVKELDREWAKFH